MSTSNMVWYCCSFDLENQQNDYAKCLNTILWLESVVNNKNEYSMNDEVLGFYFGRTQDGGINDLSRVKKIEDMLSSLKHSDTGVNQVMHICSRTFFMNDVVDNIDRLGLCYYLRIHLRDTDDIVNLQHVVLLLQLLPEIHSRIAIHLVWADGQNAFEMNQKCSSYLRFVCKQYPFFFIQTNDKTALMQRLRIDGADHINSKTFFPLLIIDKSLHELFGKKWTVRFTPLEVNMSKEDFFTKSFIIEKCSDTEYALPLFQICLRMMAEGIDGNKYRTVDKKNELGTFVCQLINDAQGMSLLEMGLFAILGLDVFRSGLPQGIDTDTYQAASDQMGRFRQVAIAVFQLIENAAFHSQNNSGVFTFRLHNSGSTEYLCSRYPQYVVSNSDKKSLRDYLEIIISDGNLNHGIISHFLSREINKELMISGICLSDFFGRQTNETEQIWNRVHQKRPELCHGLRMFANVLQNLNGTFRVSSGSNIDKRNVEHFHYQHATEAQEELLAAQEYWMPGTQYEILINRNNLPSTKLRLFDTIDTRYSTTAADLVPVLECEKITYVEIPYESYERLSAPSTQEEKNEQIGKWRERINQLYPENVSGKAVYRIELDSKLEEYLGKLQIEPFCKGLLSSRFFHSSAEKPLSHYVLLSGLQSYGEFDKILPQTFAIYVNRYENRISPLYVFYKKTTDVESEACSYDDSLQPYTGTRPRPDDEAGLEMVGPRLFPRALFPTGNDVLTPFEISMIHKATLPLCGNEKKEQGYMIDNTHMRLGNKVHLDRFYEMSLFFEDPNNAYYTAFLFVQKLIRKNVFEGTKHLILYGYASYSSAILWAMRELIHLYQEQNDVPPVEVDFVIYQNDLKIESNSTRIQMYYSNQVWQQEPKSIGSLENVRLVQIVPIASSLTTFDKMYMELERETGIDVGKGNQVNLTATWVKADFDANPSEEFESRVLPTDAEKSYWEYADRHARTIKTNLRNCNEVEYLVSVASTWHKPMECTKCFPSIPDLNEWYRNSGFDDIECLEPWQVDHSAIFEIPLIDTDSTSTVPTQQLYTKNTGHYVRKDSENDKYNDVRVARMENHILYKHISRGKNHYQYYIRTRNYFQQERESIQNWLQNLRNNDGVGVRDSVIDVLVIPRHASCVEFGQYVYEYYFKGEAESIIVNTEKVFRSNFKAEYLSLFQFLKKRQEKGAEIRFYYVDVALTSGDTFKRATSLIYSCLQEMDIETKNDRYLFHKVFMLVNRMSTDSMRNYANKGDFYAYVNLHISSMRSFGNSCVPCKLQQEAEYLYMNSATKSVSEYWDKKRFSRKCIPFDKKEVDDPAEDYQRMACTHRANHYFQPVHGLDVEQTFAALRDFISEIQAIELYIKRKTQEKEQGEKTEDSSFADGRYISVVYTMSIDKLQTTNANAIAKQWLAAAFKVVSRPFFSFDFHIRQAVMDMFLILSEMLLKGDERSRIEKRIVWALDSITHDQKQAEKGKSLSARHAAQNNLANKSYLLGGDKGSEFSTKNIEWLYSLAQWIRELCNCSASEKVTGELLVFWRDNILKGLVDMKSNYLIRHATIEAVKHGLADCSFGQQKFMAHYLRSIMRLINSCRDDTKSVWLESSLRAFIKEGGSTMSSSIFEHRCDQEFSRFFELLLVENNRPLYQGVREVAQLRGRKNSGNDKEAEIEVVRDFLNAYQMQNVIEFLKYDYPEIACGSQAEEWAKQLVCLSELYLLLDRKYSKAENRYIDLRKKLLEVVKNEPDSRQAEVFIFGKQTQEEKKYLSLPSYYPIFSQREQIDDIAIEARVDENEVSCALNNDSYYLLQKDGTYNILVKLDNNYEVLNDLFVDNENIRPATGLQKIEPIYIYIRCGFTSRRKALLLVRKILMFRCKLVACVEEDFNNNAIANLAIQEHWARVLSTDKVGDHQDNGLILEEEQMLTSSDLFDSSDTTWQESVNTAGETIKKYEAVAPILMTIQETEREKARKWYLLNGYVNARIARLYRTMLRVEALNEKFEDYRYYGTRNSTGAIWQRPATNLETVFFTPLNPGHSRQEYLRIVLELVRFGALGASGKWTDLVDDGSKDGHMDGDMKERLEKIKECFKKFTIVSRVEEGKQDYCLLSEYVVVLLFDSILSALKASRMWQNHSWKAMLFTHSEQEKWKPCVIQMYREEITDDPDCDYLVIRNRIECKYNAGAGMSQAAMKWYIEKYWERLKVEKEKKVVAEAISAGNEQQYVIKLPILKKTKGAQ